MSRPLFAWTIFTVCLVATTSVVGWLTHSAWRADQSRQQALLDSEIRNALWRMDSLVAPLLAIESNRASLTVSFAGTPTLPPNLIKGYVVRDSGGRWTIRGDGRRLEQQPLPSDCPLVKEDWKSHFRNDRSVWVTFGQPSGAGPHANEPPDDLIIWPNPELLAQASRAMRDDLAGREARQRNQLVQQVSAAVQTVQQPVQEIIPRTGRFVPLRAQWVRDELVLARERPSESPAELPLIEICWLNWKEWERLLSAQLVGASVPLRLFPGPVNRNRTDFKSINSWQMVSLPIRVEPVFNELPTRWPWPYIAVWGLLLAVALAFGWLMRQTLALSERRAAFVSAVTHELRTPLTTFRLYTEMLCDGLAAEPAKQQAYFEILNREANRLTHLVENVLAYARLEHGRSTARNETLTVGELIDRCRSRLEQRVVDSPLTLSIQLSDSASAAKLTTNAMTVEQILFNLIDNSCKYARDTTDPRIVCDVQIENGHMCLRVSDFGPGLSKTARRALFHPFQKSASEAAESAPGIGLGLALSQRLAYELGGALRCYENEPIGLVFEMRLPLGT